MVLDGKLPLEYPVNARVPQGFIFGPTPFLLYINDFPDDDTMLMILLSLYSKCDQIK